METSQLFPRDTAHPIQAQTPGVCLGLTPEVPILLEPLLENEAWKIPVDLQAMNWKLYFNKQMEGAFLSHSSALDGSENKIPVPK